MRLKADLFPYPVLNSNLDDFNKSSFKAYITSERKNDSQIELNIKFELYDETIMGLIRSGKAAYSVHLEGQSSSYRKVFTLGKNEDYISVMISSDQVNGKIEANMMVIAIEEISNYSNPNFNDEFYGKDFTVKSIHKGDILAFDVMAEIKLEFSNKENPNAKSMIRIAAKEQEMMSVDIDGDIIRVYLPLKEHEAYSYLSQMDDIRQRLLLATIVLPALSYTIERVKDQEQDENLEWFLTLKEMLKKLKIDIEKLSNYNSLEIAQQLLDYPFKNTLYSFYDSEVDYSG
ncbi:hypothetical protein WN59_05030 [Salinicoccus sediminis]|uniref:Uncharacterized protein n=1 Tax=Salinicoccus sediminis TaxID=1432562 RepID=A0A0M2SMW8_9STAP|nr:hypothetical protein [Salinicoccus sediminis]KKK35006.1 hypothetical protein WN59_05030 [Salinicoccus sediminis]